MKHIVDTCPLTTFEGGLNLLHEADGDIHANLHSAKNRENESEALTQDD